MYIGEVSKRSGLSVKAIRFYEEKELIRPPQRLGRYRIYQESDIEILLLIKEARQFGTTISELRGVIVYKKGEVDWKRIKEFLGQIKYRLNSQIEDLNKKIDKIDKCYKQII